MAKAKVKAAKFIIIAEDDSVYASVFKNKLTGEGYRVKVVEDGVKLLETLKEEKPDLLILDMIMPMMDGFGVLEAIKKDAKLKGIKVLVATNLGQEEDMKKCISLGAKGYFVKSDVSISEMVDKVKAIIK